MLVAAVAGLQSQARPVYRMKDLEPMEEKLKWDQYLHISLIKG